MNLPTAYAHTCRRGLRMMAVIRPVAKRATAISRAPKNVAATVPLTKHTAATMPAIARPGTLKAAPSGGSLSISASSAALTPGWVRGVMYCHSHTPSHRKPTAPVPRNAQYQPYRSATIGTMIGVARAPTLVPALNNPVANARSRCGNHSAMLRTEPGKMAASPSPSSTRQNAKPATEAAMRQPECAEGALHRAADDRRLGVEHGRHAPQADGDGQARGACRSCRSASRRPACRPCRRPGRRS